MTDARTIQELKARHRQVDSVRWNVIACQVWHDITDVMDPDADLMAAIEAITAAPARQGRRATRGIRH
jgi:hypothetical protein